MIVVSLRTILICVILFLIGDSSSSNKARQDFGRGGGTSLYGLKGRLDTGQGM